MAILAIPDASVLGTQFTASAVSVFVINWLKGQKWLPFVNANSKWLNRTIALATSGASAMGIHWAWSAGTLTVTGLSLTAILAGVWMWLKSFALQEWIYQSSKQNSAASNPPPAAAPAPAAAK